MGSFSKFVAFFGEPPRIEISGGIVSIQLRSGRDITEMAMPIPVFARYAERSQRALRHHAEGREIIIVDD